MVYYLTCIQSYDFKGKEGNQIKGNKLHVLEKTTSLKQGCNGYEVGFLKIGDETLANFIRGEDRNSFINKNVNVEFDRNGTVAHIELVK